MSYSLATYLPAYWDYITFETETNLAEYNFKIGIWKIAFFVLLSLITCVGSLFKFYV